MLEKSKQFEVRMVTVIGLVHQGWMRWKRKIVMGEACQG